MFETMTEKETIAWLNATSDNDKAFERFCEDAIEDWQETLTELLVGNSSKEQEAGRSNLALGVMDACYESWGDRWESMLVDFLRRTRDEQWNRWGFGCFEDTGQDDDFLQLLSEGFEASQGGYTEWASSMVEMTLTMARTRQWTWGDGNSEGNVDWLDWVTSKYTGAMTDLLEEVQADIWVWVKELLRGATRRTWRSRDAVVTALLTQGLDFVEQGYADEEAFLEGLDDALDGIRCRWCDDAGDDAEFTCLRYLAVHEGELDELGELTALAFYLDWDASDIANRFDSEKWAYSR